MKQMTFAAACKDYFGMKPGQPLPEFLNELRALTPKDKDDLSFMFKTVGYEIVASK